MFGKKKKQKLTYEGKELHINPPANTSLQRKEGRLERIKLALEKPGIAAGRKASLEKRAKVLDLEIKIYKGDID